MSWADDVAALDAWLAREAPEPQALVTPQELELAREAGFLVDDGDTMRILGLRVVVAAVLDPTPSG